MAEAVRPAKKRQKPGKTSTETRRNSRNAVAKKQTGDKDIFELLFSR